MSFFAYLLINRDLLLTWLGSSGNLEDTSLRQAVMLENPSMTDKIRLSKLWNI